MLLLKLVVMANQITLIARKNYNRVVCQTLFSNRVEQTSDLLPFLGK